MNALKKLMAPHTMPMNDRPLLTSIDAVEDFITAKLRDEKQLKEFMADLEKLRQGSHENTKLQAAHKRLGRDKMNAIEYILDDRKLIKANGVQRNPPGTGKSWLAIWFACVAMMFDPPTIDIDDEWDRPLDLGPQVRPENFDEVDLTAPLRAVQLTDEQKAAAALITPRTKVLIVSGQNTAVDDLLPRLLPIWKDLGSAQITERELVILRLYSWESEGRDFIRRFAKVGRHIQRTDEDNAEGILMTLLNAFLDKAHYFDREGRKARSSNDSIVDKAVELYKADRNATESRKYDTLVSLINQVQDRPEQIYQLGKSITQLGKSITRLVKDGPLTDAVATADVVFGTSVGAADRTFRRVFRPHYIISDLSLRDRGHVPYDRCQLQSSGNLVLW